ncbi:MULTISPECIES: peptide chain release factor H [unclassified Butyrivibrio]|uniref:peptide chain release factor H n=1 Tax=unclassified Butyrivibrio TaxID=2639466 RepID=UPI00047A7163|nr:MULTISPECIES: peptide chain release factor H [unclassified Butyrivibrio]
MILQISSGKGPVECRVAVGGIYRALKKEFSDIEMITSVKGEIEGAFSSIVFSSVQNLSGLEGTMQWICKSKYRPGHKRKNWFVDVSVIPEPEVISEKLTADTVRIEKFHSGGPGGQNVNKVETGVRVIHIPTGITVSSTRERSQFANKQDALKKLSAVLRELNETSKDLQKNDAWSKHAQIVRGNPIRVYEGEKFELR